MTIHTSKVLAYITTNNHHLLVFRHPYAPEAGVQVPAGTVEADEQPSEAVMREAFEETGLLHLQLHCLLGTQIRDMSDFKRDEVQQRSFYHLFYTGAAHTTWRHAELYSADKHPSKPHIFEFFWVQLPHNVPVLIADHGKMLPELLAILGI